jgi:hypothetical protein
MEKHSPIMSTFDGRRLKLSEIDDQHLCNIVHYTKYIGMSRFYYHYKDKVDAEIAKRMGNNMLPYKPPIHHIEEIKSLEESGMLKVVDGQVIIIHKGEVIGEVIGPKSKKI